MDVFATFRAEHRQAKTLLNELAAGEDLSQRERTDLLVELHALMLAHNQAEELVLYAPLLQKESTHDLAMQAQRAHAQIEALMAALDRERDDDRWRETLEELRKAAERHIEEEEGAIFEALRGNFDERVLEHLTRADGIEPLGEVAG